MRPSHSSTDLGTSLSAHKHAKVRRWLTRHPRWIFHVLLQRLDVTIKPTKLVVNAHGEPRTNNRDALGWYDEEAVYLPTNLIREASGGALKETQIARILDEKGYLARRESARRLAVRYVPKVGKCQCYALSRARFGWGSDEEEPELAAVQGGRR